jgi:hypothetical protein
MHNQLSVLFIHPKVLHTYKKMNAINPTFDVYVISYKTVTNKNLSKCPLNVPQSYT